MENFKTSYSKRMARQLLGAVAFPVVLVAGWFFPFVGYFIPACMLLGVGISFFQGRKWCDWYCPRGSFFDSVIGRISPKKEIPAVFRSFSSRLGMLVLLMSLMVLQIIKRWPDPYKIGMFFVVMITLTSTLGVILGLIFHPRIWCYLCPVGSLSNWIGKGKRPLLIDGKLCNECALCHKACPMQLEAFSARKDGIFKNGDCLKCGLCVASCPKKALRFP